MKVISSPLPCAACSEVGAHALSPWTFDGHANYPLRSKASMSSLHSRGAIPAPFLNASASAASVRQRLLNRARERSEQFNYLLDPRDANERLPFCLAPVALADEPVLD